MRSTPATPGAFETCKDAGPSCWRVVCECLLPAVADPAAALGAHAAVGYGLPPWALPAHPLSQRSPLTPQRAFCGCKQVGAAEGTTPRGVRAGRERAAGSSGVVGGGGRILPTARGARTARLWRFASGGSDVPLVFHGGIYPRTAARRCTQPIQRDVSECAERAASYSGPPCKSPKRSALRLQHRPHLKTQSPAHAGCARTYECEYAVRRGVVGVRRCSCWQRV